MCDTVFSQVVYRGWNLTHMLCWSSVIPSDRRPWNSRLRTQLGKSSLSFCVLIPRCRSSVFQSVMLHTCFFLIQRSVLTSTKGTVEPEVARLLIYC